MVLRYFDTSLILSKKRNVNHGYINVIHGAFSAQIRFILTIRFDFMYFYSN